METRPQTAESRSVPLPPRGPRAGLPGLGVRPAPHRDDRSRHAALDPALEILTPFGPETRQGLTNHAPMAVEALCAVGRGEVVPLLLGALTQDLLPREAPRDRISPHLWRAALGRTERFTDWSELLASELDERPWPIVLERWVRRLAAGYGSDAVHGAIRTGHAVRALGHGTTPLRLRELADGLALWASTYQELPTRLDASAATGARPAADAVRRLPLLPFEQRLPVRTIVARLGALEAFAPFAPVIGLLDVRGSARDRVREMSEAFARIFLSNARERLGAIIFTHAITGPSALGHMLPYLDDATARTALRFAWQASAALYATHGHAPAASEAFAVEIARAHDDREALIDRAIALGDEHAIKLVEACLGHDARSPSPVLVAAAAHGLSLLGG